MNKIAGRLCCLLLALLLLPETVWSQYGKVYCSSSQGNDSNDGLSPRTALKTIACAAQKGRHILLKGGDVFYEPIRLTGSEEFPYIIEGYGKGVPVISGFKIVRAGKGLWQQGKWDASGVWQKSSDGDIWRLDMWNKSLAGMAEYGLWPCNIGCVYLPQRDEIHGIRCGYRNSSIEQMDLQNRQFSRYMEQDYDYYQFWEKDSKGTLQMPNDRYLYMKLSTNPNAQEMWLSSGMTGVSSSYVTLQGLKIWGWGCHGVGTGTHTNVLNCEIDVIGGSLFIGYTAGTRYGNGIEFYISSIKRNCLCQGNVISRTFDCGVTIQGAGFPGAYAENIIFRKNIIKDCRQSCEFWQVNADKSKGYLSDGNGENQTLHLQNMKNCRFEKNVCYPTRSLYGLEGAANNSQILFYQSKGDIHGLTIAHNTFIGGDTYYFNSGDFRVAQYKDNKYICTQGSMLNRLAWRLPTEKDRVVAGDADYTPQREGMYRYDISLTESAYASSLKEATTKTIQCFCDYIGDKDLKVIIKKQLPKFK